MVRAFTPADVTHHNEATVLATESPAVGFTRGAVEGRGGIVVLGAQSTLNAPFQWDPAVFSGFGAGANMLLIMSRPWLLDAEQTWTFKASGTAIAESDTGVTANWCWIAEEWDNLALVGPHASASNPDATYGKMACSTGTTAALTADYVVGIAAVMVQASDIGSAGFATSASWSNSFTETDVLTIGAGTSSQHIQLRVARRYGTLGETGPWETTCTFAGSTMANMASFGALAVFEAARLVGDI